MTSVSASHNTCAAPCGQAATARPVAHTDANRHADASPLESAPTRPPGLFRRIWQAVARVVAPPRSEWSQAMVELQDLDSDTLRDVGAPPWLANQIAMQREHEQRALRHLHHR